jgi:hypothetical protein
VGTETSVKKWIKNIFFHVVYLHIAIWSQLLQCFHFNLAIAICQNELDQVSLGFEVVRIIWIIQHQSMQLTGLNIDRNVYFFVSFLILIYLHTRRPWVPFTKVLK